jgi:hypothetical protein
MRQPLKPFEHECDYCGSVFPQGRIDHRFCSRTCKDAWHVAARRAAMKLYREALLKGEHAEAAE